MNRESKVAAINKRDTKERRYLDGENTCQARPLVLRLAAECILGYRLTKLCGCARYAVRVRGTRVRCYICTLSSRCRNVERTLHTRNTLRARDTRKHGARALRVPGFRENENALSKIAFACWPLHGGEGRRKYVSVT